ncbi:hypothetical protein AB0H92_27045 [Streptomyces phaeochromogenes]|uniref:hypothetical protein n=1 Tax=Streptomyces phaeochromogenes TaxID=1923 RepID=UPI0033D6DBEF
MSVAALGARLLGSELKQGGLPRALDAFYPGAPDQEPTITDRLIHRFGSRLTKTASGSAHVVTVLTQVTTTEASAPRLLRPAQTTAAEPSVDPTRTSTAQPRPAD